MKQEFKLLKIIIRDYTPQEYSYEPEVGDRRAKQADYDNVDVIPVSDPNAATMSQKVVQYQAVMQMAQQYPQIYDLPELNKQMLEVLGIKNIGKLIPSAEEQTPKDPVAENMAIINGKPVRAFAYQDHQAHIQVHMSAMQDPKIQQMIGQNPQAQTIQAAALSHINEHVAFEYRKQIEEQLGVPLPDLNEVLPEDVEVEISKLMASAAQKLLAKDQGEAQQQQIQQQQQDPIIQMQQQELAIKQQESQAKAQKMMADTQLDQQRLQLEEAKLAIEKARIDSQERIAGANLGAKVVIDKERLSTEQQRTHAQQMADGMRIGLEAENKKKAHSHTQQQLDIQRNQQKPKE